jgi:hypothetical protein
MTFREKSALVQIVTIVLVYGFAGFKLWGLPLSRPAAVVILIGLSMLMAAIVTVSHVALVIYRRPEKTDERDAQVALRSTRNGYYALAAGLWLLMMLSITGAPYGELFLSIMYVGVAGELVRLTSQVAYYRRAL